MNDYLVLTLKLENLFGICNKVLPGKPSKVTRQSKAYSPINSYNASSFGVRIISVRRFWALPLAVSLEATG
jgi:hypothetical protein